MRSVDKSRRKFLKTTGAVSLAVAAAPAFVGATDKGGTKPVIVGVEGYRYEVHHNFLDVPSNIPWQETHGVAVDKAGQIYVKHRTKTREPIDAIVVFDRDGKYVRSFGKMYHGGGHGVDIREEEGEECLQGGHQTTGDSEKGHQTTPDSEDGIEPPETQAAEW
ncbi:MAG TPA: twin-arginine translocation signal domain-containing protein [Planctomycetaceae bacterium]|nr:twin-arginine translocation signal domain-containing protein [Planctomycetaceae bacterium]